MSDAVALQRTEGWDELPWKTFERNVFRLQKRIYRAARRVDFKCVRNLQRLLLRSYSARCLAVRRVTQDNRGKRTAGVDGVANLSPPQRIHYVELLRQLIQPILPIRRVYIDKKNGQEKRPLGIPTMFDRARQALVKQVLEPEWEAKFEPNSYGFRPGRSCHDAMEAIFQAICRQPKFVLDADIEKCFDKINHEKLLAKLSTIPPIADLIRGWLKAGILEKGEIQPSEAGTPQGSVVSPLLANVALHGLEAALTHALPKSQEPRVIRYADDLVILHRDLETLLQLKERAAEWLSEIGLNFKESKTCITHTLYAYKGNLGFDFLGFTVRQYKTGKHRSRQGFKTIITPSKEAQKRHQAAMAEVIRENRGSTQAGLIFTLNRKIRGWANYYRSCCAKQVFNRMDYQLFWKLRQWAKWRHPHRTRRWHIQRYWSQRQHRLDFCTGETVLGKYAYTPIRRHIKVRGDKSPFDGDWTYWATRLGRDPSKPERITHLLKRQRGRCQQCGLYFRTDDIMEVHHRDGEAQNNAWKNLALLHGHCHDEVHG
jgi:RNA-directed DNA polymerase